MEFRVEESVSFIISTPIPLFLSRSRYIDPSEYRSHRVVQRLEKSPGLRFPTSRHWTLVARSSSINLGRSTALRIAFG